MGLIEELKKQNWLKDPNIIESFLKIKREDFVLDKDTAYTNEAMPIGYGQTISQPLVVAFMLEQLKPKEGETILDIGSGSGWTTAILASIVGEKGKVIALEIIPELMRFGKENVSKYNFIKKGIVKFICADGSKGYKKEAPYDKILVSASADQVKEEWKNQLKIGGIIVASVGESILVLKKKSKEDFDEKEHYGFSFVPLV